MGKPWRYHGEWRPWEVPRVLIVFPPKNIEGPLRDFLKANPWPHPCQTKSQKPSGPAAPYVFGLRSGLGCGLGFAFIKSLVGPSIFSLGSPFEYSLKPPMGLHSPCYLLAFPTDCPTLCVQSTALVVSTNQSSPHISVS